MKRTKSGTGHPMTDESIVAMYLARDEAAIRATDEKYGHYLHRIAMNILSDRQDSEECLNDTYLRTWNSIPPTVPLSLGAYVSRIMRNVALNKYQARGKRIDVVGEDAEDLAYLLSERDPYTEQQHRAIAALMEEYLRQCTPRRRYIFVSRYWHMTPVATIARQLMIGKATVNRELAAIRKELQIILNKEGFDV